MSQHTSEITPMTGPADTSAETIRRALYPRKHWHGLVGEGADCKLCAPHLALDALRERLKELERACLRWEEDAEECAARRGALATQLLAAEARVEELERERDAAIREVGFVLESWQATSEQVEELQRERNEAKRETGGYVYDLLQANSRVKELERALERIQYNAEDWHGPNEPETGHVRALRVIARWARNALGVS